MVVQYVAIANEAVIKILLTQPVLLLLFSLLESIFHLSLEDLIKIEDVLKLHQEVESKLIQPGFQLFES